ncbi:unnamed protein product [Menidia menidia]|uniref:(Atlantic silverside) hypothetical protein n=1 Tax=Menidia menidia TaxID=238744 RepID=A0A8S4BHF6_9TELE|nr:unnamed protein product [Menidia menidia]
MSAEPLSGREEGLFSGSPFHTVRLHEAARLMNGTPLGPQQQPVLAEWPRDLSRTTQAPSTAKSLGIGCFKRGVTATLELKNGPERRICGSDVLNCCSPELLKSGKIPLRSRKRPKGTPKSHQETPKNQRDPKEPPRDPKEAQRAQRHVADLYEDLRDGHSLISLLEVLSGETLPREKGRMRFHKLQNVQIALDFLKHRQVKLVNIRNDDIADGNPKLTLGLIWTIILHFQSGQKGGGALAFQSQFLSVFTSRAGKRSVNNRGRECSSKEAPEHTAAGNPRNKPTFPDRAGQTPPRPPTDTNNGRFLAAPPAAVELETGTELLGRESVTAELSVAHVLKSALIVQFPH